MGGALSSTKACFTGGGGLATAVLDGDDGFVKSASVSASACTLAKEQHTA